MRYRAASTLSLGAKHVLCSGWLLPVPMPLFHSEHEAWTWVVERARSQGLLTGVPELFLKYVRPKTRIVNHDRVYHIFMGAATRMGV